MLEQLARNPRRLVTHQAMLFSVWGPSHTRDSGCFRIHLAAIRKTFERDPSRPEHFITEPGIGYRVVPEAG